MLSARLSFQSHRNTFAGASTLPLGSTPYVLGQNSTQPRTLLSSAAVDSIPGMFEMTRRRFTAHWLTVVSGMPTSASVRSPKASQETQIQRVSP